GNHLSTGQVTQITHVVVRQNHFRTVFLAKGPRVCDGGRANRYRAVGQPYLVIGTEQGGQVPLDTKRAIQSPIIDGGEQPVVEVVLMQHVLKRLIDDVLLRRQRRKRRKARLSPQKFGNKFGGLGPLVFGVGSFPQRNGQGSGHEALPTD